MNATANKKKINYILLHLIGSKYGCIPKISFLGALEVGKKQCTEKEERNKSES